MNQSEILDQNQTEDIALASKALVDQTAFAALFERYFPRVHKYVLYRVNYPQAADDLTGEIFERMFTALPSYKSQKAAFGAWIFGIARHVVNDHHRNNARHLESSIYTDSSLIANDAMPEEASLVKEADRRLLDALMTLSDREKDIIGLKFSAELTNRQIARLTRLGESHVGVILYRAMQKLRSLLSDLEETDERK